MPVLPTTQSMGVPPPGTSQEQHLLNLHQQYLSIVQQQQMLLMQFKQLETWKQHPGLQAGQQGPVDNYPALFSPMNLEDSSSKQGLQKQQQQMQDRLQKRAKINPMATWQQQQQQQQQQQLQPGAMAQQQQKPSPQPMNGQAGSNPQNMLLLNSLHNQPMNPPQAPMNSNLPTHAAPSWEQDGTMGTNLGTAGTSPAPPASPGVAGRAMGDLNSPAGAADVMGLPDAGGNSKGGSNAKSNNVKSNSKGCNNAKRCSVTNSEGEQMDAGRGRLLDNETDGMNAGGTPQLDPNQFQGPGGVPSSEPQNGVQQQQQAQQQQQQLMMNSMNPGMNPVMAPNNMMGKNPMWPQQMPMLSNTEFTTMQRLQGQVSQMDPNMRGRFKEALYASAKTATNVPSQGLDHIVASQRAHLSQMVDNVMSGSSQAQDAPSQAQHIVLMYGNVLVQSDNFMLGLDSLEEAARHSHQQSDNFMLGLGGREIAALPSQQQSDNFMLRLNGLDKAALPSHQQSYNFMLRLDGGDKAALPSHQQSDNFMLRLDGLDKAALPSHQQSDNFMLRLDGREKGALPPHQQSDYFMPGLGGRDKAALPSH
eukprot:gene32412-31030_t